MKAAFDQFIAYLSSDPRTSIVGCSCILAFLGLTVAVLTKTIDGQSYAIALGAVTTFGTGLLGIFGRDKK